MKTSRILFFGLLIISMSLQAQKIYVRAGLGVAVSTAADIFNDFDGTSESSSYMITSKKAGIGTGLPFVLAAGYKLNENFGFELGVDYFYGFSIKSKNVTNYSSGELKWHGQMLSLVPAFIMTIPFEKTHPYARLGLKLGVLNSVVYKNRQSQTPSMKAATTDIESKRKDYGGIAIGVQGAIGTDYAISDMISLFGEIQVDGISYSPKHGKFTEYSINGVDNLNSRTEKENKWDYQKEVDLTQNIPDDQPNQTTKVNYHFNNVGLVIGVKFNFK